MVRKEVGLEQAEEGPIPQPHLEKFLRGASDGRVWISITYEPWKTKGASLDAIRFGLKRSKMIGFERHGSIINRQDMDDFGRQTPVDNLGIPKMSRILEVALLRLSENIAMTGEGTGALAKAGAGARRPWNGQEGRVRLPQDHGERDGSCRGDLQD